MKKVFTALLILNFGISALSQVAINIQLPAIGVIKKSQLWNLSLINSTNSVKEVQIEMTFTDPNTNQRILGGLTRQFTMNKGIKQITPSDIMPVIYTTYAPGYNINNSPEGFLPIGSYIVCYSLIEKTVEADQPLGDECDRVDVEPLVPPMLTYPADSDHIETSRPSFTWLAPSPLNLFTSLQYDWRLVQVQPAQTGASAIQQNIPILSQANLFTANFQYPMSYKELDTGKVYAWQIAAKSNNSVIAKSEVWTFRITHPVDEEKKESGGYYIKLEKLDNALYTIGNKAFCFEYLNELNDSLVSVSFKDLNSTDQKEITPENSTIHIKFGQNFLRINTDDIPGIINKHVYLLELINSGNEKWYAKFEYRK